MTNKLIEAMARAMETDTGTHCGACQAQLPFDGAGLAQAILKAISDAGYAVVPREPTEAMISAGIIERHDQPTPEAWSLATANIYRAMINAGKAKA